MSSRDKQEGRDEFELNDSFETAKDVALDKDISATISPAGDRDFYRVQVDSPGLLRVVLERWPQKMSPALAICAEPEKPLAEFKPGYKRREGQNVALEAEVPAAGKYGILIHDGAGWNEDKEDNVASDEPYRFRVEFVPVPDAQEPNNTADGAKGLPVGKPLRATLFPKGDQDWFRVDLPEPGLGLLSVWLSRVPENVTPKLSVLCPGDRRFVFDPHYKRREGSDLSWSVETWSPGPYFVGVQDGRGWNEDAEDNASSVDPYEIEVGFAACPDTKANKSLATAEEIKPGAVARGALFPAGAVRFYRVPIPEPGQGRLNISLTELPDNIAPQLALLRLKPGATLQGLDEADWRKRFDDWCRDPQPSKDLSPLEEVANVFPHYKRLERLPFCLCKDIDRPGDYFLVLRDGRSWNEDAMDNQSGTVLYRLWVEYSSVVDPNEPCDTWEQARPLTWDKPAPVALFPDGDKDLFTFTLEKPAQVDVALTGIPTALVPLVELFDAKGAKLPFPAAENARPIILSSRIGVPGKYFLSFRDRNNRSSKDPLTVLVHREEWEIDPGEPNDAVDKATPLVAGREHRATLFPTGDVDFYSIDADGPGRIQIVATDLPEVTSTLIRLLDSGGKTVLRETWSSAPTALAWETREKRRFYLQVGTPDRGERALTAHEYRLRLDFTPVKIVEDLLFPRADADVYTVELTEPATLAVFWENPGALAPRLRISSGDKVIAETTTYPDYDGYLHADGLAAGKYTVTVSDSARCGLLPYRLTTRVVTTWKDVNAPKAEEALELPLGNWQAIRMPPKREDVWFRVKLPTGGRLRLLAASKDPNSGPGISATKLGTSLGLDQWLSTPRGGVASASRIEEEAGELLVRLSMWRKEGAAPEVLLFADLTPLPAAAISPFASAKALPSSIGPLRARTETWVTADAAGPGRIRVLIDGLAEPRTIAADLFFGPKNLGDRPKVVHLVGGYGDANLSRRLPDLDWTVVSRGNPIPALTPGSTVLLDSFSSPIEFEKLDSLLDFARQGGRVLVLSPRANLTLFGAKFTAEYVRDRSGYWDEKQIVVEKKLDKGTLILDARYRPDPWIETKLTKLTEGVAPISLDLASGAQVWEIAVPSEGRLYARISERSSTGMPFAARVSGEFVPAETSHARTVVRTTVEGGQTADVVLFNRAWGFVPRLTVHEEVDSTQGRPKVLLLTRRRDDLLLRRYPGIDFVRRFPDEPAPLRDVSNYRAVLFDQLGAPNDFALDLPETIQTLERFAEQGGRVVFQSVEFGGPIWGGKVVPGWSADPVTTTPDLARLLPGVTDVSPERIYHAIASIALDANAGFVPCAKIKDAVVIAAKPVGKGLVVVDLQPFLRSDMPASWDAKLCAELGLTLTHRWVGEFGGTLDYRSLGAEMLTLAPAARTNYCIRLDSTEIREHDHGTLVVLPRSVDKPLEPNNAFGQATPIHNGQAVRANLTPAGDRDFFEIAAPSTGVLNVTVLNVPANQDVEVTAYRTPNGVKHLKPSPRILYLVGGRTDYNLHARFDDLAMTRLQHDAPDAAKWTEKLANFDVAILDGLTSIAQFGMDRPETYEKIEAFAKGGGRFVLLCPQGVSTSLLASVVSASSSWDNRWRAEKLIDGVAAPGNPGPSGWCCGNGAKFPHEIVFAFRDRKPAEFDRFVLHANTQSAEARLKDFEILVSASEDPAAAQWESLGKFVAKPTDEAQVIPVAKRSARFVKLVVTSNYGHAIETQIGEFEAFHGVPTALFGLSHAGHWNDEAISGDPSITTGPLNGWSASDAIGWWLGWKEAGFEPLWTFDSTRAATVVKRVGKGAIVADTQEIGYPGNTAGNWKVYALLEFPRQITPLGTWNGTQQVAGLGSESFDILVRESGTIVLDVHDLRGSAATEMYALMANFRPLPLPFEPNDAPEQAVLLPFGKPIRNSIESDTDVDWFTFHLRTEGTLHLRMSGTSPYLDVEFALFHESDLKNPAARWQRSQDHTAREEAAAFRTEKPGTYYLSLADGGRNWSTPVPFSLTATFDPGPAFEEPNDTRETARPLRQGFQSLSIAPGNDTDWYAFEVKEPGEFLLDLLGPPAWQNPGANLFKGDKHLVTLNVEGDGASESFRYRIAESGKYFLQVYEDGSNHASRRRWRMRAEWPAVPLEGPPRVTKSYPQDRATRVPIDDPIEIGFDRPPDDVRATLQGSTSGEVAVRIEPLPLECAVRLIPEKGLAPGETVTVRLGEVVFVFTTAPAIPESEGLARPLKVVLPEGRTLGIGKHSVAVRSVVELAEAPILRIMPKGGRAIDVRGFASDDQKTWQGSFEIVSGTPEGMAVFETSAKTLTGEEIRSVEEAARTFLIDATPPGVPLQFAARPRRRGTIELNWNPPAGESATRYRVYRNGEKLSETAEVKATDVPSADGSYRYSISAVDAAGNEGARSEEIAAVSDRVPPDVVPKELAATIAEGKILLSWQRLEGMLYNVRRGDRRIAEGLTEPTFVDRPGDGTWNYSVCATDAAGNEGPFTTPIERVLDTLGPLVTLSAEAKPPLGPGSFPLKLEFSEPLREAPRLYVTPRGKKEIELPLKSVDETHFVGLLEVKAGFGEGRAGFRVECRDACGNAGRFDPPSLLVDTQGPTVALRREGFVKLARGRNRLLFEADEPLSRIAATASGQSLGVSARSETEYWADLEVASTSGTVPFEVVSEDSSGHKTTQTLTLEIDGIPPVAPADLVGAPTDNREILLRWTAIPEKVTGYRIYRGTAAQNLGKIADVAETRYADAVAEERIFFYAVTAVDLAGNESKLPAPIQVLADVTATGPPEISVRADDAVRLTWTAPEGARSFNVYRDVGAFADRLSREPIARRIQGAAFDDVPVSTGKYHYAVTALDDAGNESRLSGPKEIEFVQKRPTAAIRFSHPSPIRENVRLTIETLFPLVRPPTFAVALADGSTVDLPVTGKGTQWETALQITSSTPNGKARFLYRGEAAGGMATDLVSEGDSIVIDTAPPSVWLEVAEFVKPGTVAVRLHPSEPLTGAKLTLALPGENPRAVPLVENAGQIEVPSGVREGIALFQIEATDLAGNVGRTDKKITVVTKPPAAPKKLEATPRKGGAVALTWSAPGELVEGFNVYRNETPVALRLNRSEFIDTPSADGTFEYSVSCVGRAGLESATAKTTAKSDRTPPSAPRKVTAALKNAKVEIAWEAEDGTFRVYRSKAPIKETNGKRFEDVPRESGRFYYAVTAVDTAGNESAPTEAYPVEYTMVAATANVKIPAPRLRIGKHPVFLSTSRPLVEPPMLTVRFAGSEKIVPMGGTGSTWSGSLTIDESTPEGPARFSYAGKVAEGVVGDTIVEGESFEVDASPPTARIRFDSPLERRDRAVAVREGKFAFTLKISESLAGTPTLSLLPRKGDPISIPLTPVDDQHWRGEAPIGVKMEEGAAAFEFHGKDVAGNEGNRLLEGNTLVVDRTAPKALDPVQGVAYPGGKVRLAWNRPVEEGDVKFQIFRSNKKIEDLSALSSLAERRAILAHIDTPPEDGTYHYAVRVVDDAGNLGASSASVEVRCDMKPPDPPHGLKAEDRDGVMHLTWTPPAGEKAFIYNAYIDGKLFSPNIPGEFAEIYGAPAENGSYLITLTAVDASMNESKPSEAIRFEYRKFPALSRIKILKPMESEVKKKETNRVRPGRYDVRLTTNKLLAEPPTLAFAPEDEAPIALAMTGGGGEWSARMEVLPATKQGAAYFKVSTKDTDGLVGTDILEGEYFVIDTSAPASPPRLAAESQADGTIRLTWKTPEGEVPHFYRVYRAGRPIGLVKVRYENESQYEYRDFPPKDGMYEYAVTGLDLAGNESAPSERVSAESKSTTPRVAIRLYTAGDQPVTTVGRGKIRVVLESSRPLDSATLRYRDRVVPKSGEFVFPDDLEDDEYEFRFDEGYLISEGKTFRVDRKPPMAELLIPKISQLQVQLSWDGSQKHKLETPPLGIGTHEFELTVLRDMPDDERSARWANGDPGDPKELIGPPELALETSGGKVHPIEVTGFGARWRGTLVVTPEMANGKASFRFHGFDRFGNEARKLAPIRRWHAIDELDMSDHPRVIANYATTGGSVVLDTSAPGAPKLRDLIVRKLGVVEIGWEQPEGEPPATYRVYRSLFPTERGPLIQENVLARVWVDAPPQDGNWYYTAAAVDLAGNEGTLSNSKMIFVDSIKPELKITPVPLDEDFVIIEVETNVPVVSLELKFPGDARKEAILGGESGVLEKKEGGGYIYRQKLPRPQLQEVFNGKVEVVVHSPDPVGNVVSSSTTMSMQTVSSDTGGSIESVDGQVQLVIPPGIQPTVPGKKEQKVVNKDNVYFVNYAYIPTKQKRRVELPCSVADLARVLETSREILEAMGAKDPLPGDRIREIAESLGKEIEIASGPRRTTDVDPLPPEVEVVGKPYVVQINVPPTEPMELKASATQADLSGIKELAKLVMKIPPSVADQYSDPEFMKKRIKVLAWNPAPEGGGKPRWDPVSKVQLDPETREIIVPADKVTTYVIVSERTPPSIIDLNPPEGASFSTPIREISCRVVDKGTGVATGAENRIRVEIDGKVVDPSLVTLGEGDPTEVPVTVRLQSLEPGPHRVRVYAEDIVENVGTLTWEFTYDDRPPEIVAVAPPNGAIVTNGRPAITARLMDNAGIDPASIEVRIDGEPADPLFDETSEMLTAFPRRLLTSGEHQIVVSVKDRTGKAAKPYEGRFTVDAEGPRITPRSDGTCVVTDSPSGVDPNGFSVTVDGAPISAKFEGSTLRFEVADGAHRVEVSARDRGGNRSRAAWTFSVDRQGPVFFDLGARGRLALRIVDFGSGVDPATLRVDPGVAFEWDPATGVFVADGSAIPSVADRAGNVSVFSPPGIPISEFEKSRAEAGKVRPPTKREDAEPIREIAKEKPSVPTSAPAKSSGAVWLWILILLLLTGGAGGGGYWWWRRRRPAIPR